MFSGELRDGILRGGQVVAALEDWKMSLIVEYVFMVMKLYIGFAAQE